MHASIVLGLLAQGIVAFPDLIKNRQATAQSGCTTSDLCNAPYDVSDQTAGVGTAAGPNTAASKSRTNCGAFGAPCTEFDAASQYVSTSGDHAFIAPTPGQIRGMCPGLNAAANHGYLPRSGVATQQTAIDGLGAAYGMGADLAEFLAAYAIIFDGDLITMTWSIGGPPPASTLGGLLGRPQGLSYSHNKYEGDSSIGRCDAYTNGGDAHSLSPQRFATAFSTGMATDRYTLDDFSQEFTRNTFRSEGTNPYYFAPLFSTTLVSPAAYNFVINFMSNRSAEEPAGYLNGAMFKQFFAMTGEYPNFTWQPGQEQIPENWYRRPTQQNEYSIPSVFGDLIPAFIAYPNSFRFGGNTGSVNTYTGIDIANFTGGVYNADTLFEGNNLMCFFYQNQQQAIPDQLKGGLNDVTEALNLISPILSKAFGDLDCPQLQQYDDNTFDGYPGHTYSPTGEANIC